MPAVLRTPDEQFTDLPEFPFEPHYLGLAGDIRMHYVDEGPRDAPVVLMLHGEPTWSFVYRKLIAPVAAAGYRAVAPDHVGFGRSDKLAARGDYSYQRYVDWMSAFVERLGLERITLVCQDWGGPIGLRVLAQMPQRFDAVLAANTLLPNCQSPPQGVTGWPGELIETWVRTTAAADDLPVSEIVASVCVKRPPHEVLAAYDAPFPEPRYKTAVLEFPSLIPTTETMAGVRENRAAWEVLERFDKPFRTAFSDGDPSTKGWEAVFRRRVAGARGQPHAEIAAAGHFLQEEQGEALAGELLALLEEVYDRS